MQHALTRYRVAAQIGITDFARRVGTSRQTIHRIENGKQTPSLGMVKKLIAASAGLLRADDFLIAAGMIPSDGSSGRGEVHNTARPASPSPATVPPPASRGD